jgi:signal transduction histidine kinase
MSFFTKEPIKRKLLLLVTIFIVAIAAIVTVDSYLQNSNHEFELAVYNQMAHRRMGRVIIRELIEIEGTISKALAVGDIRNVQVFKKQVSSSINIIQSALGVLQNGGTFTDILPANINDKDEIKEEYAYWKGHETGYFIEIIDLTPKIIDIRELSEKVFGEIQERLNSHSEGKIQNNKANLQLYVKQMDTYLLRSREDATKIFYESHQEIQQLEQNKHETISHILYVRYLLILAILISGASVFVIVFRQIGEIIKKRKRAEVNTKIEKDRLQSLIDGLASAGIGIDIVGVDYKIHFQNVVLEDTFGTAENRLCYEIYQGRQEPCKSCPVTKSIEDRQIHQTEISSNSGRIYNVLAVPFVNSDGTIDKAIEIIRDITESIKAKEELELAHRKLQHANDELEIRVIKRTEELAQANKLLQKDMIDNAIAEKKKRKFEQDLMQASKMESIGTLAAGIAHEINTPIQFVGDNTNFLSDSFMSLISLFESCDTIWREAKAGGDIARLDAKRIKIKENVDLEYIKEEIPSAIEQSLEGVKRVTKIVSAMKNFAHSNQGTKSMSNLNEMLQSTLTVARNELKYVADVETDLDPELPEIECYRDDLNQVFLNLLVNAAHTIADVVGDASSGKGTITVSTERDNDNVIIKISDTGKGIPKSIQERVFDPFFSTKDVGKGSGQGLAIARKIIVEKHEGSLDFETEEGKGTTFIIRLPISIHEKIGEVT